MILCDRVSLVPSAFENRDHFWKCPGPCESRVLFLDSRFGPPSPASLLYNLRPLQIQSDLDYANLIDHDHSSENDVLTIFSIRVPVNPVYRGDFDYGHDFWNYAVQAHGSSADSQYDHQLLRALPRLFDP